MGIKINPSTLYEFIKISYYVTIYVAQTDSFRSKPGKRFYLIMTIY